MQPIHIVGPLLLLQPTAVSSLQVKKRIKIVVRQLSSNALRAKMYSCFF